MPLPEPGRFDRQIRFAPLGDEGQRRIRSSRVLVVGCGALGGVLAQSFVRMGVGELVLVDRDVVEPSNLARQVLFEDRHAAERTPKAEAAAETLARVGGPTRIVPHAAHLDADNVDELAEGAALLLDGTDNLSTRYLLNDFALERGIPWVYAGVVGASGLVLPVLPGRGPCFACVFPVAPPPGTLPTCETAGVILPAVGAVASLAAGLGARLLARPDDPPEPGLIELDVWNGTVRRLNATRDPVCRACVGGERLHLHGAGGSSAAVLCGRNTVQIPRASARPDLGRLAARLAGVATAVERRGPTLRFEVEACRLIVFGDGRALVEGTDDPGRARAIYDRYVT